MPGPFYFAWVDPDEEFDPDVHLRFDERVLSIEIDHAEGSLPSLTIALKNPKVGLLTAGRNVWCWLAWDNGTTIEPIFHGRLIGIPSDLHKEAVTLDFTARPADLVEQKLALATLLRELPYHDPLWVDAEDTNPDIVLEARSALFHSGRVDHTVTISDILQGEDGTITVDDHIYASLKVSYGQTPLREVAMTANLKWLQKGTGEIDLTTMLWEKFRDAGSPFRWPLIGSFTSDGILADWPQPLDDIDGGWSVSPNMTVEGADYNVRYNYQKVWVDQTDNTQDSWRFSSPFDVRPPVLYHLGWVTWTATFQVLPILQHFVCQWDAERDRSETVKFTLQADVQPILVDPEGSDREEIEISSDFVDKPIDPGGIMPIGDLRRNCYFPTDRGQLSLQYLLLLARAKLRYRSRAITMSFRIKGWLVATGLSCRKSVLLVDDRLPGGQALGKITSYKMVANKSMYADITIECACGYGVALPISPGGDDVYADAYAVGYTATEGSSVTVLDGELAYDAIDVGVVDDDGVDLFNITPETAVVSLTVTNGPTVQQGVIDEECAKIGAPPDPIEALRNAITKVDLELVPVEGGAFHTDYEVVTEKLVIPKMVDLEAA